jgi:hypothetical protein
VFASKTGRKGALLIRIINGGLRLEKILHGHSKPCDEISEG